MPRGAPDPDWTVEPYRQALVYTGTTIFADNHIPDRPRIVEVNMLGEVVWEYLVPADLKQFNNPGFDIEPLANGNVLFVLPRNGIYEVDRKGKVVWSFLDPKVSHDADRLPNGNTIFVYGAMDQMQDAQVREVDPSGKVVWSWYARDHFNRIPYITISDEGWTHTNSVSRLTNGNTLISLRNFGIVAEVDPSGKVIRTIGEGLFEYQHDPEMQPSGNLLVANHNRPDQTVIEIDPATGKILWSFTMPRQLIRDADRLPNGNTLITGHMVLAEVTPAGEIAWRLRLNKEISRQESSGQGFYKAIRTGLKS
jgi:outer membrane protein assembly factor BamB